MPECSIQLHILPDRGGTTCARQPSARRPPTQPAGQQVLLDPIEHAPKVIASIVRSPAGEKLRWLHATFRRHRESQCEGTLRESDLFISEHRPLLHVFDL